MGSVVETKELEDEVVIEGVGIDLSISIASTGRDWSDEIEAAGEIVTSAPSTCDSSNGESNPSCAGASEDCLKPRPP